jgi:hypothetical protein
VAAATVALRRECATRGDFVPGSFVAQREFKFVSLVEPRTLAVIARNRTMNRFGSSALALSHFILLSMASCADPRGRFESRLTPSSPRSWGCSRSTELKTDGKSGRHKLRRRAEVCSRTADPHPIACPSGYQPSPTLTPLL